MPAMCWRLWSREHRLIPTNHVGAGALTRPAGRSPAVFAWFGSNPYPIPWRAALACPDEGVRAYAGSWWVDRFLLGGTVAIQDFLGVIVFYLGLVAEDLVVRGLQQLFATVAELGSNGLLHARVGQLALSRRFL